MNPDIRRVRRAVARQFGTTEDAMNQHSKRMDIWWPRAVAMHLCRNLLGLSYPAIGQAFGFDHTTVHHACRRVRDDMGNYPWVRRGVDRLTRRLNHQMRAPTAQPLP